MKKTICSTVIVQSIVCLAVRTATGAGGGDSGSAEIDSPPPIPVVVDKCATIGFRCVVDLDSDAADSE